MITRIGFHDIITTLYLNVFIYINLAHKVLNLAISLIKKNLAIFFFFPLDSETDTTFPPFEYLETENKSIHNNFFHNT